jgi:serine/threonine protein kinase
MLSALGYLHHNGIVHRDLKLENFIFAGPKLGEGSIKLCDFGLSRACLESEVMTQDVGSVVFKAPEVRNGSYSQAADMWSFGVISFMMLTGIAPWEGSNRKDIEASITKESADPKAFKEFLIWFSGHMVRCAFFGRNLHSRMPLDPTHVRLKRTCV